MLFNSQLFLFAFLPAVLASYWGLSRFFPSSHFVFRFVLLFTSWIFYGYWDIRLLPLLLGSIGVNYLLLHIIIRSEFNNKTAMTIGVILNLGILGFFKYFNFFTEIAVSVSGFDSERFHIILPLAISFFTFQQISCLVDAANGKFTNYKLLDYALFVSFFPQLVAGPIVRHHELIPQLAVLPDKTDIHDKVARGLFLLTLGLMKKVYIADTLSTLSNPLFEKSLTASLHLLDAWTTIFAFGFQIYFDFSGYSDMAVGLALLFGIILPINFRSPYRATSLVDFWRRWHMTLSFFLRDYLYIPLGGNRRGLVRWYFTLFFTMTLGGLWHGAGWTFIVWGILHGTGLVINQTWRRLGVPTPEILGWIATFLFTMIAFLIFRAETLTSAGNIFLSAIGYRSPTNAWNYTFNTEQIAAFLAAILFALIIPEIYEISKKIFWRNVLGGFFIGVLFISILIYLGGSLEKEFIYFQF